MADGATRRRQTDGDGRQTEEAGEGRNGQRQRVSPTERGGCGHNTSRRNYKECGGASFCPGICHQNCRTGKDCMAAASASITV